MPKITPKDNSSSGKARSQEFMIEIDMVLKVTLLQAYLHWLGSWLSENTPRQTLP